LIKLLKCAKSIGKEDAIMSKKKKENENENENEKDLDTILRKFEKTHGWGKENKTAGFNPGSLLRELNQAIKIEDAKLKIKEKRRLTKCMTHRPRSNKLPCSLINKGAPCS
jgi:hypothetical protein